MEGSNEDSASAFINQLPLNSNGNLGPARVQDQDKAKSKSNSRSEAKMNTIILQVSAIARWM